MFKQNKWEAWYDSLPESTKTYLKSQPVWHDKDMFRTFIIGIFVGFLIGVIV